MKKEEVRLQLLSLQYERNISKAHTIFSSFWDLFFGLIIGGLSLSLGFIETKVFEFHRLSFLVIVVCLLFVIGVVGMIAFYFWNESRLQRNKIEKEILSLIASEPNQF